MGIAMTETQGGTGSPDVVAAGWERFDVASAEWLLGLMSDQQLALAAAAALVAGCKSSSLSALAGLRYPDQVTALPLVFGTCAERGVEFPLRGDAITRAVDDLLARLIAGSISPEDASVKLWSLADLDYDLSSFDDLHEFRELAITLSIAEDPDCELDLDLDEWRTKMLALASEVLDRGGIARR
jgi:hypothetical protein